MVGIHIGSSRGVFRRTWRSKAIVRFIALFVIVFPPIVAIFSYFLVESYLLSIFVVLVLFIVIWRLDLSFPRIFKQLLGIERKKLMDLRSSLKEWRETEWRVMGITNYTHLIDSTELEESVVQQAKILREDVYNAIGGLTVTLDYFVKEKEQIQTELFPFPDISSNTYETLLHGIMNASGLTVYEAKLILDNISNIIKVGLGQARSKNLKSLEIFPIGLYEYQLERFYFSPHSVMLQKHYQNIQFSPVFFQE